MWRSPAEHVIGSTVNRLVVLLNLVLYKVTFLSQHTKLIHDIVSKQDTVTVVLVSTDLSSLRVGLLPHARQSTGLHEVVMQALTIEDLTHVARGSS